MWAGLVVLVRGLLFITRRRVIAMHFGRVLGKEGIMSSVCSLHTLYLPTYTCSLASCRQVDSALRISSSYSVQARAELMAFRVMRSAKPS